MKKFLKNRWKQKAHKNIRYKTVFNKNRAVVVAVRIYKTGIIKQSFHIFPSYKDLQNIAGMKYCIAIFAAVFSSFAVRKQEHMRNVLFGACDAARVLALQHVPDLLRQRQVLLLHQLHHEFHK